MVDKLLERKNITAEAVKKNRWLDIHLFFPESACEGFFAKKQPLY